MAELGDIQFRDVNSGTSRVDRSAELRGLNNALELAGTAIVDNVEANVRSELEESIDDSFNEAVDAFTAPVTPDLSGLEGLVGPELEVAQSIRQAQAQVDQAPNGSFRAAALLRLQRVQAEARAKYGFMREDIDRIAGNTFSNSAKITQLSMMDSATSGGTAGAAQAQDYLDRVIKYGYETLEIDPSVDVSDPRFAVMYAQRSKWNQERAVAAQIYAQMQATGQLTAKHNLNATRTALQAASSDLNIKFYEPVRIALEQIQALRAGSASDADKAASLNAFANEVAPMYIARGETLKRKATEQFMQAWAGFDSTQPEYQSAKALLDLEISNIDYTLEALKQGDLNIKDFLDTQAYIRGSGLLENMPTARALADLGIVTGGPDFIRLMDSLDRTFGTAHRQDRWGNGLGSELDKALGSYYLDHVTTENLTDPNDIARQRDENDARSSLSGTYTESVDPNEMSIDYFDMWTHNVVGPFTAQPSLASNPDEAKLLATRTAAYLQRQNKVPTAGDQLSTITDFLASDAAFEAAATLDRSGKYAADWANQLDRSYFQGLAPRTETARRLISMGTQEVFGERFVDLFDLDASDFKATGRIRFRPNGDKIRAAAGPASQGVAEGRLLSSSFDALDIRGLTVNGDVNAATSRLQDEAVAKITSLGRQLEEDLYKYIRVKTLHDFLSSPGLSKPNYEIAFRDAGTTRSLAEFFTPAEEE